MANKTSININPAHKGDFTKFAKAHGLSVQEMAAHVMANKDNYSAKIVKQANFAKNAKGFKHAQVGIGGDENQLTPTQNNNWTGADNIIPINNLDIYNPLQGPILNEGRTNIENPAIPITRTTANGSVGFSKKVGTGRYKDNPYVTDFNILASGITGFANAISNNKLKNQEQADVLHSLEPQYWENADAQGNGGRPAYTKYGGGKYKIRQVGGTNLALANAEAKRFAVSRRLIIGEDAHVDQLPQYIDSRTGLPYRPMPVKPKAYNVPNDIQLSDIQGEQGQFWYNDPRTGDVVDIDPSVLNLPRFRKSSTQINNDLAMKQTGGLPAGQVNAEEGEIVQSGQGELAKVDDNAGRHEEGGVDLNNVSRVLEDTSDKRKDKASKTLLVTPEEMESLFGFKPKRGVSHSKAFELANEYYDKKRKKVKDSNEVINKKPKIDKIDSNTAKLNYNTLQDIPSKEDVYDALYMHQEHVKDMTGIEDDGTMKKKGGKFIRKYQVGGSYAQAGTGYENTTNDLSGETDLYGKGWRFIKRSGDKDYYRKPNGQVVAVPGKTVPNSTLSNFSVDDILNQPRKYATFHRMMNGAPDAVKRKAAEQLLKNGKMPGQYVNNSGTDYGYIGLPGDGSSTNSSTPSVTTTEQGTDSPLNPSVNINPKLNRQPINNFYEPIYGDELAPAGAALVDSLKRDPELYNPVQFNQLKYKRLDPTAAMNANQADYNAGLSTIQDLNLGSGAVASNVANLQSQKYSANDQTQGQYDNQNSQIDNNETTYNTQVKDRQSTADATTRAEYYRNVQLSKEAQREQRLKSIEDISRVIQMKRRQNKSGNLILRLSPAFNQEGDYNGYQYMPSLPSELGYAGTVPVIGGKSSKRTVTKTWTDAAGQVHKEVSYE